MGNRTWVQHWLQPKLTFHSVKEKIIFRNRLNQESPLSSLPLIVVVKEAFSVLMLCTPVFIFTSSSSALLGRPRCGLSIWLSLLIFNTLFWVYANIFHKKTDKTWKNSKSAIFVWYKNGHWWLPGVQRELLKNVLCVLPTSASGVAGLAGALASNPIDVVKVTAINLNLYVLT